jgi:hypothetical protein
MNGDVIPCDNINYKIGYVENKFIIACETITMSTHALRKGFKPKMVTTIKC